MANLGIVSYESFYSLIDKDTESNRSARILEVQYDMAYGQVFRAQSSQVENIFFMADVNAANEETLEIDIVTLTGAGGSGFVPSGTNAPVVGGGVFQTVNVSQCNQISRNLNEAPEDSYWYSYNAKLILTEGNYYAILFRNNTASETDLPKIYFTEDYRSDVFPQIIASTSGASPSWDNDNFSEGAESFAGTRLGSLCCGFLGKTVEEAGDSFNAGEITIGGSDTRRGYPVFLTVTKTEGDVSVKFTQAAPALAVNGDPEETNRSYMSWSWYQEGTLPISNNTDLLRTSDTAARLQGVNDFVVFTQPNKFAPYPKVFFPETELNLKSEIIGINPIKQGYVGHQIQDEDTRISETSNRFVLENWAHFAEKRNAVYNTLVEERNPQHSTNPSYIDFTLEQPNRDVDQIGAGILLSDAGYLNSDDTVRGFNNVVRYREKYIAFGKHTSLSVISEGAAVGTLTLPILVSDSVGDDAAWSLQTLTIDQTKSASALLDGITIRGVYDVIVKNTDEGETLFILFQAIPNRLNDASVLSPYFLFAFTADEYVDPLTDYDLTCYVDDVPNTQPSDGRFWYPHSTLADGELLEDSGLTLTSATTPTTPWVLFDDTSGLGFYESGSTTNFIARLNGNTIGNLSDQAASIGQYVDVIAGKTYNISFTLSVSDPITVTFSGTTVLDGLTSSSGGTYTVVATDNSGKLVFDIPAGITQIISGVSVTQDFDEDFSTGILVDPWFNRDTVDGVLPWQITGETAIEHDDTNNAYVVDFDYVTTNTKLESIATFVVGKTYYVTVNVGDTTSSTLNGTLGMYITVGGVRLGPFEDSVTSQEFVAVANSSASISFFNYTTTTGTISIDSFYVCEKTPEIGPDYQTVKFVDNPDSDFLVFTASNYGFVYNSFDSDCPLTKSGGKFGLWKIPLTETYVAPSTPTISDVLDSRGFNGTISKESEITSIMRDGGTVYYGTCVVGQAVPYSLAEYGYGYGYGSGTYGYGYFSAVGTQTLSGHLGEIFSMTGNLDEFDMVLSGNKEQSFLTYYSDASRSGASSSYFYNIRRANSKVAFMVKVGEILHTWVSPFGYAPGNPFHIATDLNLNQSKVLRRFPIDAQSQFTQGDAATQQQNYLIHGYRYFDGEVDSTSYDAPLIPGLNVYETGKAVTNFSGGVVVGDQIYLTGFGYNLTNFTAIEDEGRQLGVKWIIYDARTINDAFRYVDDASYVIYSDAEDLSGLYSGLNELTIPAFSTISYLPDSIDGSGGKHGVYNGGTMTRYYFSPNMYVHYHYPALRPTESNPRIGIYCGVVSLQPSVANRFIAGIKGNIGDINPRLIKQHEICYLVTDNIFSGTHVYKTYGMKQDPDDWGLKVKPWQPNTFYMEGESVYEGNYIWTVSTGQSPTHSGVSAITEPADWTVAGPIVEVVAGLTWTRGAAANSYNFNFDYDIVLPAYSGAQELADLGVSSNVSNIDGKKFISPMKSDLTLVSGQPEQGHVTSTEPYRYILGLTAGVKRPQNFSFFYQFNYLRAPYDTQRTLEDTTLEITPQIISHLGDGGFMNMVIKYAPTWERLYDEPTGEVPLELAFTITSTEPNQQDRFLCHHTFQSDIQDMFWRIESRNIITPYDPSPGDGRPSFRWNPLVVGDEDLSTGGFTEANGLDPELTLNHSLSEDDFGQNIVGTKGYTGESDPYAEILVRGLRFNNIDLAFEDEIGPNKAIAITGIVNSGDPKTIIDGNGVEVSSNDEIVIDFPTHVYISEISFIVEVSEGNLGDSNTQFDFYYLSQSSIHQHNINVVDEVDWIELGSRGFDPGDYSTDDLQDGVQIIFDSVKNYAKTLRIFVNTGLKITISDLKIKTFASAGGDSKFTKTGQIGNEELIVVDDVYGLIEGKYSNNVAAAYAEFKNDSSLVIEVGDNVPVNKITMNVVGGNNRNLKIEYLEDGESVYTTAIYDEKIPDYEYSIVDWSGRTNSQSDKVDIEIKSDTSTLDQFGTSQNNILNDVSGGGVLASSNYSQYFGAGALRNYIFRPNIKKARNLTISNSEEYSGNAVDIHGTIVVNAQMDSDGGFKSDIGEVGIIERSIVAEFPVVGIDKVKITVYGFEADNKDPIRINGFKIYSPIVDSDGDSVWPTATLEWNIVLRATALTSVV